MKLAIFIAAAALLGLTPGMPASCIGCAFDDRNLAGADLAGATYIGSSFARANLRNANLSNSNLEGVDFRGANLRGANLHGAKLCDTNESGDGDRIGCADFRDADVHGADLRATLICGGSAHHCAPLDAGTLRAHAHSTLAGATLP